MAASLPALLAGGLALLALPLPLRAHALESSLERLSQLNNQLLLESRFGTGEPADAAVVRLIPPGGEPIELGRTDADGRLQFQLPQQAGAGWELQVDRGAGHRDYLELPPATNAAPAHSLPRPALPSATLPSATLSSAGLLSGALIGLGWLGVVRRRRG
jgi:nickel transport protein